MLGAFAVFRTAAQWQDLPADPANDPTDPTVHVRGAELTSGMTYSVQLDCDSANPGTVLSPAVTVALWATGDVDDSGFPVDILDATRILDGFRNQFHTLPCATDADCWQVPPYYRCDMDVERCLWITRENVDIAGPVGPTICTPERDITILDVVTALDAFRQLPDPCAISCPP